MSISILDVANNLTLALIEKTSMEELSPTGDIKEAAEKVAEAYKIIYETVTSK